METESKKLRHPSVPYLVGSVFNDKTANGLTKCIIAFLRLSGHQAERISVTGRCIDQRKTYTDVLGFRRTIGSVKWIKPSMQVGSADISATINGRSVKVEVKIGSDRQRPSQRAYQREVEDAGGLYVIAKDFQGFYDWYNRVFRKQRGSTGGRHSQ